MRPFGPYAMGTSVEGSDVDCAVVTPMKSAMKERLLSIYGADEARDDSLMTRLIMDIEGISVDVSIHASGD